MKECSNSSVWDHFIVIHKIVKANMKQGCGIEQVFHILNVIYIYKLAFSYTKSASSEGNL